MLAPTISGTAQDGQLLTASNGTWLDGPTSFGYQWQDCDASGANCSPVAGATGINYTLADSDIQHTIRVVVTGTNGAGSGSATSAATSPVLPPPPPANTGRPVISGTAVQGHGVSVTTGSWTNHPESYTYVWQDCDSSGSNCSSIGGAESSSYELQSADVGHALEVTVTASNRGGSGQATSGSFGPVQAAPVAPSNQAAPTISGTPQAGQTLTANSGTWSGDTPMTYSYLWSDGARGQTDTLPNSDVGQNISVTVTAQNDAGSANAASQSVGPVTPSTATGDTNCAGAVGSGEPSYASMDACGFPSPDTTGVPSGTTLTPYSGSSTITTAGTVIKDAEITSTIYVEANDVTVEDSDIDVAGESGAGIQIESGVTGTEVEYDTIHGTGATAADSLAYAVYNPNYTDGANAVTVDHVDFYNGQRILHGPGTLQNSFCLDNVVVSGAHYECVYEGGGSMTIDHNTLLTAFSQTAAIYLSTDFDSLGTVIVTNNLFAGGGYALYGGGTVSSETVTGNHFSRLYYANSGEWGPDAYMPTSYTWSGNVWDDTGLAVAP